MKVHVGIVGSRHGIDLDKVRAWCRAYLKPHHVVVSGGAIGVDRVAKEMAKELGCGYLEHLPDYNKYGRYRAPKERNSLIVRDSHVIAAFTTGSNGTQDTIDKMLEANKPVLINPEVK